MTAAVTIPPPAPVPPAPIPLPDLSPPDRALILLYLTHHSLAAMEPHLAPIAPNWTLAELYQWSTRRDISRWIDFHDSQLDKADRREMTDLLKSLARSSPNPIERRRAASSIIRGLTLPSRASSPRTHPPHRQPPEPDPPPQPRITPSPTLTPRQLVEAAAPGLMESRDPVSLATLEALVSPDIKIAGDPLTNLGRQARSLNVGGRVLHYLDDGQIDANTHRYRLVFSKGTPRIVFILTRSPTGPHPGSWLISQLYRDSS
jgi:hypothetical protein